MHYFGLLHYGKISRNSGLRIGSQGYRMSLSCWRARFIDELGLMMSLDPISIAPEAQWLLAPRFSVGKEARIAFQPRRGDAKGEIVIKISFMRLPPNP